MNLQNSRWTGALAALLAAAVPLGAAATAGNGIRFGGPEGRLHPYLEIEGRWDSNALFESSQATPGFFLHIRPGLTLTSPGDKLAFDADANLDFQKAFGDAAGLDELFARASLGLGVNRVGTLGLELTDAYQRSADSAALTFGSAVISNRNILEVAVPWRPGGGALVVTPTGTWTVEAFKPYSSCDPGQPGDASCDAARLAKLGYDELRAALEVKWRFLPRTATLVDGSWTERLPNDTTESPRVSGWRASGGFQGLITAHLAATLKAGWGNGSAEGGSSIGTWLANAELEWIPTITASARLGYVHDWGGDPGQPFALYTTHRGYLNGKMLLAGRWTATLNGQLESLQYEAGGSNRIAHIEPGVDYEVARWLSLGLGYAYSSRKVSGFEAVYPNFPSQLAYDYTKNELWLRVRGTY